jgi:hypothetical protein
LSEHDEIFTVEFQSHVAWLQVVAQGIEESLRAENDQSGQTMSQDLLGVARNSNA